MTSGPALSSPLVSTQWLADYLGADKLVVVDASAIAYTQPNGKPSYFSGHETYIINGHIPGAVYADIIDEFSDPDGRYPFTRPDATRFAAAVGALGIDNETSVVVYDSSVGQWSARLWWLFRSFGYDNVAVLDGGLTKWNLEERPLDTGHIELPATTFQVEEREGFWVDKAYVEGIVRGEIDAALVCAAPPKEFTGEAVPRSRAGHIPGSLSAPASRVVERESKAFLPVAELTTTFAPVLDATRIVTYCGGAIAASSAAFALSLLGHTNVAVYDDSLNEWVADPESELVTTV